MDRILDAVAGLTVAQDLDAIDQLFEVSKKFKPLPVPEEMKPEGELDMEAETSHTIPLDQCDTDPTYQRPLDREKVAAMKRAKAYEQPIEVNFHSGRYWIIDGQHRAEAARQAGLKEIHAFVHFVPSQKEQEMETGVMAKTLQAGDAYEGHVLPSHEPQVIEVLEGLGGERQVSKVETYGWQGRCYVVRCSAAKTITYVPYDAVEKDTGGILTQPERGMLRFDGMTEAEVQRVLKTLDAEVAPVHLPEAPSTTGLMPLTDALGYTGDVEVLLEGVGGRTWKAEWVYLDDNNLIVTDGHTTLANYPIISRHPTVEGDWRLIGPKHDLTVRPA